MKILIINNNTNYLKEIKETLDKFNYNIISFEKIKYPDIEKFTHIILTGGKEKLDFEKFKEVIKIIKNSNKPILGICFGHQLICKFFGTDINKIKYRKGNLKIKKIKEDKIFKDLGDEIEIYEDHEYIIKNIPKEMISLAESIDGNEVIKHKLKKIYGFQFHPEKTKDGKKLIKNFLNDFL